MTINQAISNSAQNSQGKKNYKTLWIMIFLFVLPYGAAFYFYFYGEGMNLSTTNYGTLISPTRQLKKIQLKKLDDSNFELSSLSDKWIIISIGNTSCQQSCQENLYKIRQIRKAVGENRERINRVFFLTDKLDIESFSSILKDYPKMGVIIPSGNNYYDFLSTFSVSGEKIEDGIYIVDPLGNYMMAYPKDADAEKILKDIRRLLKVSRIG